MNGYAAYKVADSVRTHEAWGMGVHLHERRPDAARHARLRGARPGRRPAARPAHHLAEQGGHHRPRRERHRLRGDARRAGPEHGRRLPRGLTRHGTRPAPTSVGAGRVASPPRDALAGGRGQDGRMHDDTGWSVFVACGDSFTEGLEDLQPDGAYRGWADLLAVDLANAQATAHGTEPAVRQPRRPRPAAGAGGRRAGADRAVAGRRPGQPGGRRQRRAAAGQRPRRARRPHRDGGRAACGPAGPTC
nr:hypothetical protein [Angustibacter aerolatus]